jgi:hypothetical protein
MTLLLSIVRKHLTAAISARNRASMPDETTAKSDTNEFYEERILTHRFPSEHDILDDVEVYLQMLNG